MLEELGRYVIASPYPFVVDLERSEGMWLATVDGDRMFDWAGYYASKLIAHNHPRLQEPEYLKRLALAANNKVANPDFLTTECLEYYRLIHSLAPKCMASKRLEVYTVNSGAEAVENMMKYFINLYIQKHPDPETALSRRRFIYFEQAFHGRTVFALNVTRLEHDPLVTRDFHGFDQGNIEAFFPAVDTSKSDDWNRKQTREALQRLETILNAEAGNIVGIILEPLQGAGGHRLAQPEFYRDLSRLAHEHDIALGFDEVQTAGGQTGTFFAIDQFDLPHPPQAVATAKKLGCGVVYMLHSMDDLGVLDSTWGGTLADMVRFVQEMKIVRDERLIEQAPEKAEHLAEKLEGLTRKHPEIVFNVRGMGLYQGFSLRPPGMKQALIEAALEHEGLLLLGAATDTIRLRPNLSVTHEDIDLLASKLDALLDRLKHDRGMTVLAASRSRIEG